MSYHEWCVRTEASGEGTQSEEVVAKLLRVYVSTGDHQTCHCVVQGAGRRREGQREERRETEGDEYGLKGTRGRRREW